MKKIPFIVLLFACIISYSISSRAQISLQVQIAPPAIPAYTQPPCPVDGYLWTPGYWAYGDGGYYWVPGVWVAPPEIGFLWTPGYWGYIDGYYRFNAGYWGPTVGYYGGVCYGYGYNGHGFGGGRWDGGHFRYNTAVFNVNRRVVHNTYVDRSYARTRPGGRPSFNGPGGVNARPNAFEHQAMSQHHVQPTSMQLSHRQNASANRAQYASSNHGHPATKSQSRVGQMHNRGAGIQPNRHTQQARNNNMQRGNMQQHYNQQQHAQPVQQRSQPMQRQHAQPMQQRSQPMQRQHAQPMQQRSQPMQRQHAQPMQNRPQSMPRTQPMQHAQPMQQHAQPMGGHGGEGGGHRR